MTVDRTVIVDGVDDSFDRFDVYISDGGVFDLRGAGEPRDDDSWCTEGGGFSYTDEGDRLLTEADLTAG
ncbi:MAG: hypothetical protein GY724_19105 [Actinomycetia bacterium]|nr:hypothetical protein [Actinomycetes bacterium]MCP4227625.1 hypothetical protein [Actinomycetes bacterium]MCP5034485.1 hypothetical protein [Actinomycetes bacterium]